MPRTSKLPDAADLPEITGPAPARLRQPELFAWENVLTQRFGRAFFAALPTGPGVYFFSDESGRLLYIGQSANLRARVGSYRHVSQTRHPRRTCRMVARIRKIEWEVCESAAAAIAQEAELLLERRPPFNRAGVWTGDPWFLAATVEAGMLRLRLSRGVQDQGPFPPAFRHTFAALARSIYRIRFPEHGLHLYPCGLTRAMVPLHFSLRLPDAEGAYQLFIDAAHGRMAELLALLDALPEAAGPHADFWNEDRDRLDSYLRGLALRPLEGLQVREQALVGKPVMQIELGVLGM
jgi:hypothetical protein